jgi:hypothetical protein
VLQSGVLRRVAGMFKRSTQKCPPEIISTRAMHRSERKMTWRAQATSVVTIGDPTAKGKAAAKGSVRGQPQSGPRSPKPAKGTPSPARLTDPALASLIARRSSEVARGSHANVAAVLNSPGAGQRMCVSRRGASRAAIAHHALPSLTTRCHRSPRAAITHRALRCGCAQLPVLARSAPHRCSRLWRSCRERAPHCATCLQRSCCIASARTCCSRRGALPDVRAHVCRAHVTAPCVCTALLCPPQLHGVSAGSAQLWRVRIVSAPRVCRAQKYDLAAMRTLNESLISQLPVADNSEEDVRRKCSDWQDKGAPFQDAAGTPRNAPSRAPPPAKQHHSARGVPRLQSSLQFSAARLCGLRPAAACAGTAQCAQWACVCVRVQGR